ncbi:MAG TPA: heavy metal translocating P-type ATPase, partial [Firmicutes bacterium]|nr:heavy metal translocating P-type ATPase [Bacillota bacterium]
MSCAVCANSIEKALQKKEGISEAVVNLAAGKVTVTFAPRLISLAEIHKVITDLDYQVIEEPPAAATKLVLPVTGMSCAACAA